MPHDIIDNRDQKLVDHINRILGFTDSARFAVGYFFLSGQEAILYRPIRHGRTSAAFEAHLD